MYFEKHRGLATGIAVTGSGLGAIAFPPLMDLLMDRYSWRGMLLVTSGIGFTLVPACALYRFLSPQEFATHEEKIRLRLDACELSPISVQKDSYESSEAAACSVIHRQDVQEIWEIHLNNDESVDLRYNSMSSETGLNCDEEKTLSCNTNKVTKCAITTQTDRDAVIDTEDGKQAGADYLCNNLAEKSTEAVHSSKYLLASNFWNELKSIPSQIFARKLFRDSAYLIFCAANFLLFVWVSSPFVYLVDRALQLDIDSSRAIFLLSIVAIARTVGQLVIGYVGDWHVVNVNLLYAVGVMIIGAATGLVPFCVTYATMCVYSVVFGMFFSVTSVLPMMCLIELVGLDNSTQAFGFLQLVQGIGTLLGTPIGGLF